MGAANASVERAGKRRELDFAVDVRACFRDGFEAYMAIVCVVFKGVALLL